jgi:hypothetical protein
MKKEVMRKILERPFQPSFEPVRFGAPSGASVARP